MSGASGNRLARWAPPALALLVVAGAAAMAFVFATFPDRYGRRMEWYEVTRGTLRVHNDPVATPGATAILHPGCTFHATRRRTEGWVHVVVDDGTSGWVEESALAASAARTSGP